MLNQSPDARHKAAFGWFLELVDATEKTFSRSERKDIKRSIDFYKVYNDTHDARYLNLSEDFLRNVVG